MKRFVLMHVGFERPTPEIMGAWETWFNSIADKTVENVGFGGAREVSKNGTRDLAWDMECITGYSVVEAESMAAAEQIAQSCPFIASIRIYEVRAQQA